MKFIAKLFKREPEAILYLQNIRLRSLKKLERKKRKAVLIAQKHKSEEYTPLEFKKNKKQKIDEVELKDLFEKQLDGEVDFLEGILAPVSPTKKPCIVIVQIQG